MKKLLLIALLTTNAYAKVEGTVAVDSKQVNGNHGWAAELICQHTGTTHNTSDRVEKIHLIYQLCENLTNKCTKRELDWKLKPGEYWEHNWTTTQWMTYKIAGDYQYTCTTYVDQIGNIHKQGWVTIK